MLLILSGDAVCFVFLHGVLYILAPGAPKSMKNLSYSAGI